VSQTGFVTQQDFLKHWKRHELREFCILSKKIIEHPFIFFNVAQVSELNHPWNTGNKVPRRSWLRAF
jgi:hypothetical protein